MSEHRAAAHINGVYQVLAAFIIGILGGGIGWFSRAAVEDAKPRAARPQTVSVADSASLPGPPSNDVPSPDKTEGDNSNPAPSNSVIQVHAREPVANESEPEASPRATDISFLEYTSLLLDQNLVPVDREEAIDSFDGKLVNWVGYFQNLTVNKDNENAYYILQMHTGPDWSTKDLAVRIAFPKSNGIMTNYLIRSLRARHPVRFTGVLRNRLFVDGKTIERVAS